MFWLALAVAFVGIGIAAVQLFLLSRLTASVRASLADSEKLRSQLADSVKILTTRARTAEETSQDLLTAHRKLVEANALLGSEAHHHEVEFLRSSNAHLQNIVCAAADTAQRRILELVSPVAAESERRLIPGYKGPADGFREFPPESSPVDPIRYPEETRTVKTSAAPKEPEPETTESAAYREPSPAPQDFAALADPDEVFKH